jgi:hypothetical protein
MKPESLSRVLVLLTLMWTATGVLAQNQPAHAGEVLAHVEYARRSRDSKEWKNFDSWTIRRGKTGNYIIEMKATEKTATGSKMMQYAEVTSELKPAGYTLRLEMVRTASAPEISQLECRFATESIHCGGNYNGRASSADLRVTPPYVFLPGEFYGVDMPWLVYSLVFPLRQTTSTAPMEIKTAVLGDNPNDPDSIGLELDEPSNKVSFVKRETVHVLNRDLQARRYAWAAGVGQTWDVWATDSGLLLAFGSEQDGVRIELVSFEQNKTIFPELNK